MVVFRCCFVHLLFLFVCLFVCLRGCSAVRLLMLGWWWLLSMPSQWSVVIVMLPDGVVVGGVGWGITVFLLRLP